VLKLDFRLRRKSRALPTIEEILPPRNPPAASRAIFPLQAAQSSRSKMLPYGSEKPQAWKA
jgi:hypothetical protein